MLQKQVITKQLDEKYLKKYENKLIRKSLGVFLYYIASNFRNRGPKKSFIIPTPTAGRL